MATKTYLAEGKDGYTAFKSCPIIVTIIFIILLSVIKLIFISKTEDEYIPLLFNIIENHFETIKRLKHNSKCRLRSSIIPLFVVNLLIRRCSTNPIVVKESLIQKKNDKHISFKTAANIIYKTIKLQRLIISRRDKKIIKKSEQYQKLLSEYENKSMQLAPEIDGRIICIGK